MTDLITFLGNNKKMAVYKGGNIHGLNKVEKVRRKNSVIWDHKYSDLIHVDPNHIDSDQPVPKNSTNIG